MFEAWTDAVDSGFGVDVIYLNYSKAFDSSLTYWKVKQL